MEHIDVQLPCTYADNDQCDDEVTTSSNPQEKESISTAKGGGVPWMFAAMGCILTTAVVAAVVVLQYGYINNGVEGMVEDRAGIILQGGINSITAYNSRVEKDTRLLGQTLTKAGNSSTSPVELLDSLNTTLYRAVALRAQATPTNMGSVVFILGPPVGPDQYPRQDHSEQNKCASWCHRAGDPIFSQVASYGVIRDHRVEEGDKDDEFRYLYSSNNINNTFSTLHHINRTQHTAPSWAVDHDGSPSQLQQFTKEATPHHISSSIGFVQNGSAFEGIWNQVVVTTTHEGRSYYFIAFRQAYIHPLNNLTIIVAKMVSANAYQNVLTQYARQAGGDNGHLILVDGLVRVIGYNHDPYGDSRLANCTVSTAPGSANRPCEDFFAVSHPNAFVRSLFSGHQSFIMAGDDRIRQRWFDYEGTRFLLVVKPILDAGVTRVIASFALREKDVLGTLKRDVVVIVVVSAAVIAVGCLALIAAGFASLLEANRTVVLVATLAERISRYDVDAADVAIEKAQSRRTCSSKEPTPMEQQFRLIVGNLRAYRPFLPSAMLLAHRTGSCDTSFSDFSDKPMHAFAAFTGSLLVVDIGNMPIATTVMFREQVVLDELINGLLKRCIETVERHKGVVELMRANQLLVSFNCHSRVARHEEAACRCAVELRRTLVDGEAWCSSSLNVAISVASGSGLVGSGGSTAVRARVLAGECVDLIRRLPALQRMLGVGVLATKGTVDGLSSKTTDSRYVCVPVDVISPQWVQENRTGKSVVYEVLGEESSLSSEALQAAAIRTSAFTALYRDHDTASCVAHIASMAPSTRAQFSCARIEVMCRVVEHMKSVVRRELPWEELEGATFFSQHPVDNKTRNESTIFVNSSPPVSGDTGRNSPLPNIFPLGGSSSSYIDHYGSLSHLGASIARMSSSLGRTSRGSVEMDSRGLIAISGEKYFPSTISIRADVCLAMHETGGLVAMKTIPLASEGASVVDTLVKEVEVLSSLNHPNITSYVTCAVNHADGLFYIMTEYLAAGTLMDLIDVSQPGIPPQMAVKYAYELASGLHYLHTRSPPMLHCDVKPQNVLMTVNGSCQLNDLRMSQSSRNGSVTTLSPYLAPEAASAVDAAMFSAASDMYALGMTTLHMLMGEVSITTATIDPNLATLLKQCLSPNPIDRPTAKEFLFALDKNKENEDERTSAEWSTLEEYNTYT